MSDLKLLLSVSLFMALAGCQTTRQSGPTAAGLRAMDKLASGPIDPGYMKAQDDLTIVSFSAHGSQVSYRSADGRISLWYPGNSTVLNGEWKGLENGMICYKYGAATYNPLTGVPGGNWQCEILLTGVGPFRQERKGDVFGLAKRSAVPFVTRKDRQQFEDLIKKLPPPGPVDAVGRADAYSQRKIAVSNAHAEKELWKTVGKRPVGEEASNEAMKSDQKQQESQE